MNVRGSDFLFDFALLLRRYPSQEWLHLADLLEDQYERARIVELLRAAGRLGSSSIKTQKHEFISPRSSVKKVSGNRAAQELEDELARSSISRLRELASQSGLGSSPKDSRKRLIGRIVKSFSKIPTERRSITGQGGDYGKWAEIILRGPRKN